MRCVVICDNSRFIDSMTEPGYRFPGRYSWMGNADSGAGSCDRTGECSHHDSQCHFQSSALFSRFANGQTHLTHATDNSAPDSLE